MLLLWHIFPEVTIVSWFLKPARWRIFFNLYPFRNSALS